MSYSFWVLVFILLVVFGWLQDGSGRSRSGSADDDDDDSYKKLQDEMEEDNLYRLWQDSNY
jgi:hypothetical protein